MHIRCTLVIYLYLLDADGVNTIVLATYTFSTGIELWKVLKVLRLRWRLSQYESELRAEAKKPPIDSHFLHTSSLLRLRWRLSQYESELRPEAQAYRDIPIFCTHAHFGGGVASNRTPHLFP